MSTSGPPVSAASATTCGPRRASGSVTTSRSGRSSPRRRVDLMMRGLDVSLDTDPGAAIQTWLRRGKRPSHGSPLAPRPEGRRPHRPGRPPRRGHLANLRVADHSAPSNVVRLADDGPVRRSLPSHGEAMSLPGARVGRVSVLTCIRFRRGCPRPAAVHEQGGRKPLSRRANVDGG